MTKQDDELEKKLVEEKKAEAESRFDIATRIFEEASFQMNGGFLRKAVINRIAQPKDDQEKEFKELEEQLRLISAGKMCSEMRLSLTQDNRQLDPNPTKDPMLTIEAFLLMLQPDEYAVRRE